MGHRIRQVKQRLEHLAKYHRQRLEDEERQQLRLYNNNEFSFEHLTVSIPQPIETVVLQRNLNSSIRRNENLLISGTTGCGKTSLFRICAGLWPIQAKYLQMPERQQMLFVSQRPYLPIGSLRFQTEFMLNLKSRTTTRVNLTNFDIQKLFQLVNMDYLLKRYDLDEVSSVTIALG
ncbi:unnamed protein product, partial [Didymodactylos carnosus]